MYNILCIIYVFLYTYNRVQHTKVLIVRNNYIISYLIDKKTRMYKNCRVVDCIGSVVDIRFYYICIHIREIIAKTFAI